ncbi:MAG: hypothetical protein IIC50_23450 [Planctomycetes bacterium]|nr:hypothetical protein [Planctomycetota bacterium]
MARKAGIVVAMGVILSVANTGVIAQGDMGLGDVSFEVTADFYGKYIWRGQNFTNGTVFQPGVSASSGGFTLSAWGNYELVRVNNNRDEFTEIDLTLDYSFDCPRVENMSYSVGVIYYDFPEVASPAVAPSRENTTELYVGGGFDCMLNPTVTWYQDVDAVDGSYLSFGVSHSIENVVEVIEGSPVSVDCSASLGWGEGSYNNFYWGHLSTGPDSELNDLVLSLAVPFEYAGISISPSVTYIQIVGSDIENGLKAAGAADDFVFAGVSFAKSFK